jgi:AraC-like DNA-binding protein
MMMLTRYDLEYSINSLYKMKADGVISFNNDELGKVNIHCRLEKWYGITTCRFSNMTTDLTLGVTLNSPLILMYFQLKGSGMFVNREAHRVHEQLHSLNHLTDFTYDFHIRKHADDEYLCIKINPALLLQYLRETGRDNPLVKFCEQKNPFITLHQPKQINPLIHQAIYDLVNCPYKGSLATAYKDNIVLNLLIHQLAAFTKNEITDEKLPGRLNRSDIDLLHDVRQYLDEHFLEVESLHQLSRKFCINAFKLKHGFKQLFSHPVMKYVDEHKMNYARSMLQQGDKAIYDIADELGYEHYNNFSTAFKKRFGHSPASLRC